MKLKIESSALVSEIKGYPFPIGTLYGLKRLQESGIELYCDDISLTDQQKKLFEQEEITVSFLSDGNPGLIITSETSTLSALDAHKNQLFKADSWIELSQNILFPHRTASVVRKTGETDISISLNLDGRGKSEISTGLGFFDHMLDQIAKHGLIDLQLTCRGDLDVDEHHTIEDVAIALGQAIEKALGNKIGIERYGFVLPMDEARATVALDLSGRPFLKFSGSFKREYVGDFPTEMVEHFFYSLAMNLKATLHIEVQGDNDHHKIEACFKGFARSLRQCLLRLERTQSVMPSSKGTL
jgi:imidazoleglycerol-phosphate dehydratase/histidinol-phosphatase